MPSLLELKSLVHLKKILHPDSWSLNTRLVYITGLLLSISAALLLITFSHALSTKTTETINTNLDDFVTLFSQSSQKLSESLIETAGYISIHPEVRRALAQQQPEVLEDTFLASLNELKRLTGNTSPSLHFFLPDLSSFYSSEGHAALTKDNGQQHTTMVNKAQESFHPLSGLRRIDNTLFFSAVVPAFADGQHLGFIETSLPLDALLSSLNEIADNNFGIVITIPPIVKKTGATLDPIVAVSWGKTRSIKKIGELERISPYMSSQVIALKNYNQQYLGDAHIYFDTRELIRDSNSTLFSLFCVTLTGMTLIFVMLLWNVKHLRVFLNQIKKALISSHANEFNDRFELDSVHCLEILDCGHKECPVHQNPNKVCYLETGDEAISPTWRNTCIFLNRYKKCSYCPVYLARHGNELTEIKHVVNTMMGLWSGFLGNVSALLSDVYRTNLSQKPSLDDISSYLEQIAQLTTYSHDLQGTIDKDEVYKQLEYVFQQRFHLHKFNLLEVNASENRMSSVITNHDIAASHTAVFFNCDLCRARRNAEIVHSANNPHLCSHFGLEKNDVRCCLPMVMGGRVGAVFTFVVDRTLWPEKQKNLSILQKYLDETAPILSSLRLLQITKEQSLKDPLTLCHNRRFMDEYLVHLKQLNERNPRRLGFIMADLDHFKQVNDEFGHHAGDIVLKQLADIIRKTIRSSDLLIRYGGEEFLVILHELAEDNLSFQIAEKIRIAVEHASLTLPEGGHLKKTLSMGVAEFPTDASEFYKTIKFADVALYQAKQGGRNKVVAFKPSMWKDDDY